MCKLSPAHLNLNYHISTREEGAKSETKEVEEILKHVEGDADKEIFEIKAKYEKRMRGASSSKIISKLCLTILVLLCK